RVMRHYGVTRLDYAPTQKLQINSSYFWNPVKTVGGLSGTDPRVNPPSSDFSILGGYVPASNYTASVVYTPTSKIILEARYGYKYLNDKGGSYGKSSLPFITYNTQSTSNTATLDITNIPTALRQNAGFTNVSNTFVTQKDVTT